MARGRSTDHAGSRNKGRSKSQSKTRNLKCYHYHKEGHYRKDCPERKGKKKDDSKTADAVVVEDNSDGADVLSVTISSSDGGDWFATYRSFDGGKVLMGNDVACKLVGIGSIQIRMHDGIVRTLTDVRHVPELRKNLISLGTLDSNGCSYRAAGRVMRIMKGALVMMKGLKQNSLYLSKRSTVTGAAATASSSDIDSNTTKLWHMCLGHMSERGMDVLSKQGLLGSKKIGKLDFCEHCVFGKQCRVKFSRAIHTTKGTVNIETFLDQDELREMSRDNVQDSLCTQVLTKVDKFNIKMIHLLYTGKEMTIKVLAIEGVETIQQFGTIIKPLSDEDYLEL
ncbi:hypothetical protein RJ640_022941 [Escallonia rubra]|uniref:GAG-pre-integrase domain-containing protein n=1 Tax=Escallonia rubra TaxID=112253 RepID=A0AA88UKN5_9ASTE|nr:hypothetical protein RJ640_022941 [Escallonia rubra]